MALVDALGKALGVPCWQLLGPQLRDMTPLSWWTQSASGADWAAECVDALAHGYTTCKLKARPWWDVVEQLKTVSEVVPPDFRLDLDFNTSLQNVANASAVIKRLEAFENVAFVNADPTPSPLRKAVSPPVRGRRSSRRSRRMTRRGTPRSAASSPSRSRSTSATLPTPRSSASSAPTGTWWAGRRTRSWRRTRS